MSNKPLSSGELLSQLNRNIDKSHHKKQPNSKNEQQSSLNQLNTNSNNVSPSLSQTQPKQKIVSSSIIQKSQKNTFLNQQNQQIKNVSKGNTSISEKHNQRKTFRQSNLSRAKTQIVKKGTFVNKTNFLPNSYIKNSLEEQQLGQNLHEILALQIGKLISEPLAEVIEASMKQKEDSIYIAYTKNDKQYLEKLLEHQKKKQGNNLDEILNLLQKRNLRIEEKLQNGQIFIDRQRSITTKSQIQQLHQMDVARLLKIKEGTIRSKLDLLHDKMFEIQALDAQPLSKSQQKLKKYQQQKLQQFSDPQNFSLNSQKTKIANDYIKHLHQQKLLLLKKMRQRQQKRQKIQLQRSQQLKQAQQMRNMAKKQQITQKIEQLRKRKQKQFEESKQKSKKVEQFLKEYRKSLPLYRKKQKQYNERYQKINRKQRQERLKQVRQNRRSLSLNQIKDHEQKYLQKRAVQNSKRQEQFKMIINAKKASDISKNYFKGFFHDKVKLLTQQQKIKFYSVRESTKLKVQRMTQFDQKIRRHHKPKIDPSKKEELERIIELNELKKKKIKKLFRQVQDQNGQTKLQAYYEEIPEVDHYKQGNKYMQISKSLAKKIKAQPTQKQSELSVIDNQPLQESKLQKSQIDSDWQTPSRVVSQQKDIWRLRGKQLHQMTDNLSPQSFQQVKKNLQIMDEKAKKREQLLKHRESDAHQQMHQKSMLDQFYLESIKNKIKLLNE